MPIKRDLDNSKYNSVYYNQMLRAAERKKHHRVNRIKESFGDKKIDLSKYFITPDGYEGIFYTIYFISIPYLVGLTFLFFYVAKAVHQNFALLDLTLFLIIWAIGYEIIGAIILISIFIAFIKHLQHPSD